VDIDTLIALLEDLGNPETVEFKRKKYGIFASNCLGIYQKELKSLAKQIGPDNELALQLYDTGIYEAKLLVPRIYDPRAISKLQMNTWSREFENWEICDSYCMGFFTKSDYAIDKAVDWSVSNKEFVKRAGFAIMAAYGFANKNADNTVFEKFLKLVEREATDDRIYVKKAVNWALRSIGKRNVDLQHSAIDSAVRIAKSESKAARWIANDALRELQGENVKVQDYPRCIYRPAL
jgi:3-methyladenine DNA glycosylase AlkD